MVKDFGFAATGLKIFVNLSEIYLVKCETEVSNLQVFQARMRNNEAKQTVLHEITKILSLKDFS